MNIQFIVTAILISDVSCGYSCIFSISALQ